MSLLTGIYNKIQYTMANAISDPKAEEFAKQQAIQKKQDEEVKRREAETSQAEAEKVAKKAADDAAAKDLAKRSQFNSTEASADIAKRILNGFFYCLLILTALYSGHIAANLSIGYNAPFRVFSFFYGTLFFFLIIPYTLYIVYVKQQKIPSYTVLPMSTYTTQGTFESIIYGWYCYKEDEVSKAARAAIDQMYLNGFTRSQTKPKVA